MDKYTFKIVIFSIQESFITLFPYLVIRAMMTLLLHFNNHYMLLDEKHLFGIVDIFYDIFPLLLVISFSIQLSKNFQREKANFTIASIVAFILLSGYFEFTPNGVVVSANESFLFALMLPLLGLLLIATSNKLAYFRALDKEKERGNLLMSASWSYIYYYIPILIVALSPLSSIVTKISNIFFSTFSYLSVEIQGFLHLLISHLIWLVGIHGTTTYRYMFDMEFYKADIYFNLPYEKFFSTLVIFGGAGSTLSLIIAILLISKNNRYKFVAKSSLPFSFFNINEPIIYGLPIAFNKIFILPFLLVPLLNFMLSLFLLKLNILSITNISIPWTTPPLMSGYMLTDSVVGAVWQLFLIVLGIFIYIPFVKKEDSIYNTTMLLREKLSFNNTFNKENQYLHNYDNEIKLRSEIKEMEEAFRHIIKGNLLLHYQPQINIRTHTIYGFEALLRLENNGKITGPTFLSSIEKAGLEEVIDTWTINQLSLDMKKWAENGVKISLNIYPTTLLKEKNVDLIIAKLSRYNVQIELLEQGFEENIFSINQAISRLKKHGFSIAIDDYGTKESNFALLSVINVDIVKLDAKLVRNFHIEKAKALFLANCAALKTLNITLIAEGVETQVELDIIKSSEVDIVQGWYYAAALPLDEAVIFYKSKPNTQLIYPQF